MGTGAVVLAALLFGSNAVVSKIALQSGITTTRLVELRVLVSAVLLVAVTLIVSYRSMRVRLRELLALALLGLFGMAILHWVYFIAIARLPVGIALLIEFTAPLMVALWARFVLREVVSPRLWWGLAACMVGLGMVAQVRAGVSLDTVGIAAALAAAVCLATYYVLGERLLRGRDTLSTQAWGLIFASLFWIVAQPLWSFDAGILGTGVDLPGPLAGPTPPLWVLVLWISVLGTIAPYLLVLVGIRTIGAARAGLIGMLEPAAAATFGWIVLGESMTAVQMVGGAVVLLGVALAETSRRRRTEPAPPPVSDAIIG